MIPGPVNQSHSARSAWIETVTYGCGLPAEKGRTPQGVRGLKLSFSLLLRGNDPSHSARSAWIETVTYGMGLPIDKVALRKECVD